MSEALQTGLRLTVFGMGLVFLLLSSLWGLITLLVRLDRTPAAEPAAPRRGAAKREPSPAPPPDAEPELEPEALAALMIAVRAHIRARRRQAAPAMRAHQPGSQQSRWVGAGRTRQNRSFTPGGRFS
jgi:Na+-transporting methylmalonyl-CoA/oxaloacetate decarboxylase gamma subunit